MNKGDIVVSLEVQTTCEGKNPLKEGDLKKIYGMAWDESAIWFMDDGQGNYRSENFRLATKAEIEDFDRGFVSIYKEDSKEIKVGSIVVVTEEHMSNPAKIGHIAILHAMDASIVPYCLERSDYSGGSSWVKNVRLANSEEKKAFERGQLTVNKLPTEFKAGDYIVTLKRISISFKEGWCFKQRSNNYYLQVEKDCTDASNGNRECIFNDSTTWRYATKEEVTEYETFNKPFSLKSPLSSHRFNDGDYVEIVKGGSGFAPEDKNKVVIFRLYRPNGVIANDYYTGQGGMYYEFIPGIEYYTRRTGLEIYGGCTLDSVRLGSKPASINVEDLKTKATRLYPIGTKYVPLGDYDTYEATRNPKIFYRSDGNVDSIDVGYGYIYNAKDDKWATIIDSSIEIIEEAKRRYPIGTKIIPLNGECYTDTLRQHKHHSYANGWSKGDKKVWFLGSTYGLNVYHDGRWAEVFKEPEPEPELNISPGGSWTVWQKPSTFSGKSDFPSDWCLRIRDLSSYQQSITRDYWISLSGVASHYEFKGWLIPHRGSDGSYLKWSGDSEPSGYTTITFEQFKEHVLNVKSYTVAFVDVAKQSRKSLDELEYQDPVLVIKSKSKSKLVIIN